MTVETVETLEKLYESKKQSCVDRMISFELSLDEWKVLHRLKNELHCAYTNREFVHRKGSVSYPSLERISDDVGYKIGNLVYVTVEANTLKNDHCFLNKPTNKLSASQQSYLHRIKKILSSEDNIKKILEPYTEAFDKLHNSLNKANLESMKKQKQEADLKALEEAETLKWSKEVEWSQYYIDTATEFSAIGVTLKETSGSLRKIVERKHKDDITGEKFTCLNEKKIWVIDKTKPIKQGNIKIVKLSSRNAIDVLTMNIDLGKIALSLHKVVEQVKEKS